MARLGHSPPGAALRYQHAAQDRDRVIADALSDLAGAQIVALNAISESREPASAG